MDARPARAVTSDAVLYTAFALVLVSFLAFVAATRIPLGFSFGDEGIYFSSSSRYLLGDRPFVDEVFNVFRSFDIVQAFFMRILPIESVLGWRWFGFALQLAAALALLPLLTRILPADVWAVTLLAIALYTPFNLWTISYNSLMLGATSIGFALLGAALITRRRAMAIVGGAVFSLNGLVYLPMLALAGITVVFLALMRKERAARGSAVAWLGGLLGGCLTLLVVLALTGSIQPMLQAAAELRSLGYYEFNWRRIYLKLAGSGQWPELPLAILAHLTLGYAAATARSRALRYALLGLAAAGLCYWIAAYAADDTSYQYTLAMPIAVFNAALASTAFGVMLPAWRGWLSDARRTAALLLMLAGVFAAAVLAYVAAQNANQMYVAAEIIWPASILMLWLGLEHLPGRKAVGWAAAWLCVTMALVHVHGWTYEDAATPRVLSAEFKTERLKGIRSKPEQVMHIDRLAAYIASSARDERFLLDYGAAGITYLTEKRPALKAAVVPATIPANLLGAEWLKFMHDNNRVARYAVVGMQLNAARVIDGYILTRYAPVTTFGPYTVWQRKPDWRQQ